LAEMLNISPGAITYDKCVDVSGSGTKRRKLAGTTNRIKISYSVAALDESDAEYLQNTLTDYVPSAWRGAFEREGLIISDVSESVKGDIVVAAPPPPPSPPPPPPQALKRSIERMK